MTWQPIVSAPRDGTPMLCYNPFFGVYNTAFTRSFDKDPHESDYEGFPCGFSGTHLGRWDCDPTHWMPLPEAPQ